MTNIAEATEAKYGTVWRMGTSTVLDLSPEAVTQVLPCMPKRRAAGPDALASEVLIAGGDRLAELLSDLMERVAASGTDPPQWKGGRLARLYKGKGDAPDCNTHRGLLIAIMFPTCSRLCCCHRLRAYATCVLPRSTGAACVAVERPERCTRAGSVLWIRAGRQLHCQRHW